MPTEPTFRPVYRSMNRPLLVWGADRALFFFALLMGAATFNLFGTLLGGLLLFGVLYLVARVAAGLDPKLLRILLNSARWSIRYDPAKLAYHVSERRPS